MQITASGGTLTQVTVASGNSAVTGQYGPGSTSWSTRWGLKPATSYTVTAVARNSKGAATTEVTHFTTRSAARILQISSITPGSGETVGVGMPIIVDFNYDVARSDRAAVEHALEVGSDVPVTGAWFWASDSEVVFRTQSYWPAHEHVLLTAHLTGVPGGPGLWGGSDLSHSFTIGDSHVVKVNLKTDLGPLLYQRVARQEDPGQRRDGRLRLLRQRLLHHQRRSPHHGQLRLGMDDLA